MPPSTINIFIYLITGSAELWIIGLIDGLAVFRKIEGPVLKVSK
jgi:hypothetical protein